MSCEPYLFRLTAESGVHPSGHQDSASVICESAGTPHTSNSIALYAYSMPGKRQKRLKNKTQMSLDAKNCEESKRNRPLAGIEAAQSAIEFVVTNGHAYNACEVQYG